MNLVALPAFADNYIWMLHDGAQAVVVDPGDAAPVQRRSTGWACSWRRF
jgi:hydroxyacylglutathione hydrolase